MVADLKDYYELLGISRTATNEEIRKAFRKLARQCHPDLVEDKLVAEEKFKEINEAYEVLSDAEARKHYDRGTGRWRRFSSFGSRHVRRQGSSTGSKGGFRPYTERPEFRTFYEEFFNGRRQKPNDESPFENANASNARQGSRHENPVPQRGKDIEGEITITLEEVLSGSVHTLSVLRHDPGSGEPEPRFLHVKIPPAMRDGQTIKLAEKGDYGIAGGAAGDLLLKIKIAGHQTFRVREADLFCDVELTPWEALFGGKKTTRTLEGTVCLKVPPGSIGGHRLRVRGRGLLKNDGSRGDLFAVVTVRIPLRRLVKKVFRRS